VLVLGRRVVTRPTRTSNWIHIGASDTSARRLILTSEGLRATLIWLLLGRIPSSLSAGCAACVLGAFRVSVRALSLLDSFL